MCIRDRFIGCGDSDRATQSVLPTPEVIYTPGEVVTDSQGYVSYRVGNTPIIITVPHDGTLTPSTFPDRSGATSRAENTRKVAEQFAYFFNDTATTEIYTLHIVGSVRCV